MSRGYVCGVGEVFTYEWQSPSFLQFCILVLTITTVFKNMFTCCEVMHSYSPPAQMKHFLCKSMVEGGLKLCNDETNFHF